MSGGRSQYKRLSTLLSLLAGCAATSPAVQHAGNASSDLEGVWTEYWSATGGRAEAQRYTFLKGGEFRWVSAAGLGAPASGTPLRKNGSFEVKHVDRRRYLLLHVAETELAGCDSACPDEQNTAFHIAHSPALLEEIELSDCPPNVEAQDIDAKYACLALGDHAFWRRGGSTPEPTPNDVTPAAVVAAPVVAEPPVEPPAAAAGVKPAE